MSDMTRKEAIEILESIVDTYDKCHDEEHLSVAVSIRKEDSEALDMAIQALEQIDILKEAYNKGYKDGQEAIAFHLELCKEEGSIIEIPEGSKNGDMIKAMFPNELFYSDGGWIYFYYNGRSTSFCSEAFWNSPYRKDQAKGGD